MMVRAPLSIFWRLMASSLLQKAAYIWGKDGKWRWPGLGVMGEAWKQASTHPQYSLGIYYVLML